MEQWNSTWKEYGEVNWVVDDSFDAVYGVELTMREGSVWNVTGTSSLTGLTVEKDAQINGTVTLDGEELIPEPGVTYAGAITVIGDYEPETEEEAEPEEEPEQGESEPAPDASPEPDPVSGFHPSSDESNGPGGLLQDSPCDDEHEPLPGIYRCDE